MSNILLKTGRLEKVVTPFMVRDDNGDMYEDYTVEYLPEYKNIEVSQEEYLNFKYLQDLDDELSSGKYVDFIQEEDFYIPVAHRLLSMVDHAIGSINIDNYKSVLANHRVDPIRDMEKQLQDEIINTL